MTNQDISCSCCKRPVAPEDVRYFSPDAFKDTPFCLPCYNAIYKKAEEKLKQDGHDASNL